MQHISQAVSAGLRVNTACIDQGRPRTYLLSFETTQAYKSRRVPKRTISSSFSPRAASPDFYDTSGYGIFVLLLLKCWVAIVQALCRVA